MFGFERITFNFFPRRRRFLPAKDFCRNYIKLVLGERPHRERLGSDRAL